MSGEGFSVAHLDGLAAGSGVEGSTWLQVRRHFGIQAFGVNAYRANAGGRVIEEHDELGTTAGGHEELYFVVSGRARFTVGADEVEAPAGTLVFVPPETKRGAFAEEDGTTVLVFGGKQGEAFSVSPWEEAADAWRAYEAKDYEHAIELYEQVLSKYPEAAGLLYNLACCEALAGRGDAAIEHLRQSKGADDNDPRFADLIGRRGA